MRVLYSESAGVSSEGVTIVDNLWITPTVHSPRRFPILRMRGSRSQPTNRPRTNRLRVPRWLRDHRCRSRGCGPRWFPRQGESKRNRR
mgnify:CR=1 FL=1